MKIITKKETETEITLTPPLFWKNPATSYNEYTALLDENTVAWIMLMDNYSAIRNGAPDNMESTIKEANSLFHPCTEVDFLSAYDEALQGMSLQPKLVTTDNIIDREAHNTIKAQNGF